MILLFTFSMSDDKYSSLKWNVSNLEKFEMDERSYFENSKISISNLYLFVLIELNGIGNSMGNVGRVRCFASTMELQSNFVRLIQTIEIDKCAFSECRTFGELTTANGWMRSQYTFAYGLWIFMVIWNEHSAHKNVDAFMECECNQSKEKTIYSECWMLA